MGRGKGHKTARELYNCSCVGSREQRTKVKKLVLPGSWNSFSLAQRKRRNLWGGGGHPALSTLVGLVVWNLKRLFGRTHTTVSTLCLWKDEETKQNKRGGGELLFSKT